MWLLYAASCLLLLSLFGCATTRPEPPAPLLSRTTSLSADSMAQLPAYLVPPPAGSTRRQLRQWQKAQAQALATTNATPRKVKVTGRGVAALQGSTVINAPKAEAPVVFGHDNLVPDFSQSTAPALATAPGAVATATARSGIPSWQLIAGVLLLCLLFFLLFKPGSNDSAP